MIKLKDNRNNKGFIIEEINDKLIKAGKVEPLETEKVENEPASVEKHIDAVKKKVEKDLEDNRKNSEATVGENKAVFAESVKLKNKAELAELLTKLKEQNIRRRIIPLHEDAEGYRFEVKFERPLKEEIEEKKSLEESEKSDIDLEALRFYVKNWSEGDNVTVTADLLNVLEQALEMAEKHGLKESEVKHEEEKKVCPDCGKEVCECDKKLKEFKPLKKEDDEKISDEWDFEEEDRLALESFKEEVDEEVVTDDDTNIKLDESLENSSNNMWDFGDED